MNDNYEIHITEGATFALSIVLSDKDEFGNKTPVDLTGFTAKSQIRATYEHTSPVLLEFTTIIDQPTEGSIILSLLDTETFLQDLPAQPNNPNVSMGYYDIFLTSPSGSRNMLMKGNVIYHHTITRNDTP